MRRPAKESDLEAVYAIYMDESVIPYLGYDPICIEDFTSIYRELVATNEFFLYEKDNELAGFYFVSRHPGRANHVAYMGTLAVSPKFHGEGIADEMLTEALEKLIESGVKRIEIIVEVDNLRAISFYKKLGFEVEGTLKKFYKRSHESHYIDDYIMALLFE